MSNNSANPIPDEKTTKRSVVIWIPEPEDNSDIDMPILKSLSGGDPVTPRFHRMLYKNK